MLATRISDVFASMSSRDVAGKLRQSTWDGSIPLEIRLHKGDCRTYDESDPYLVCRRNTFPLERLLYVSWKWWIDKLARYNFHGCLT